MKKSILLILLISTYMIQYLYCQDIKKEQLNGWYVIKDIKSRILESKPIVTVADFGTVRIDSVVNLSGDTVFQITGKIKKENINVWANETEKSVGKQIGFLHNGKIVTAPQVNQRIENGHFAISINKEYHPQILYQSICRERFDTLLTTHKGWINSIVIEMDESVKTDFIRILEQLYTTTYPLPVENIKKQYSMLENALYKRLQRSNYSSHSSKYMNNEEYVEYKEFIFYNPVAICFMIDGFLFEENPQGLFGYLIDDVVKSIYPKAKSIREL